MSPADLAALTRYQWLEIQFRKFSFVNRMMSCGAVENNQVLVSLAQIVFRFDPFRLSGIAVVIHSFNSDSRVYKVVFLQERPDRIVERLVFIKVNDHSNHISNRVEG